MAQTDGGGLHHEAVLLHLTCILGLGLKASPDLSHSNHDFVHQKLPIPTTRFLTCDNKIRWLMLLINMGYVLVGHALRCPGPFEQPSAKIYTSEGI